MNKWLFAIILSATVLILTGCESDEDNRIAQAQACLDDLPTSGSITTQADACFAIVSGIDNQKANIIKCSAKFLGGGLTTSRIVEAYQAFDNASSDKEAVLIGALALNPVSNATEAQTFCEKSEVDGLVYLANLSVIGSNLIALGSGLDPNDPNFIDNLDATAVQNMLNNCQGGGTCNDEAIGSAVVSLSGSYCEGNDDEVCQDIQSAIENSDGSSASIAQQLYNLLDD